jgi:hypothetical protein
MAGSAAPSPAFVRVPRSRTQPIMNVGATWYAGLTRCLTPTPVPGGYFPPLLQRLGRGEVLKSVTTFKEKSDPIPILDTDSGL